MALSPIRLSKKPATQQPALPPATDSSAFASHGATAARVSGASELEEISIVASPMTLSRGVRKGKAPRVFTVAVAPVVAAAARGVVPEPRPPVAQTFGCKYCGQSFDSFRALQWHSEIRSEVRRIKSLLDAVSWHAGV